MSGLLGMYGSCVTLAGFCMSRHFAISGISIFKIKVQINLLKCELAHAHDHIIGFACVSTAPPCTLSKLFVTKHRPCHC